MVGTTISHYKVLEKIGQGGMGEVYRAEDTNLSREVAIKVLPEQFTQDPQRLARFEREAKLLASLNHPNIAAVYSFEHADEIHFLVLELVPGETLAERVAKGPVPVEEALEVCRQIAEGVEAAHEKGVIHRDLKPANVKVTPEGKVKILDFGLAKAFGGEVPVADISQSPTLTEEMTRAGVILGTAAYMSPEQARGEEVDKRTDIFAFGCVLYELLTGKRTFDGKTVTDTLAKVLEGVPDWKALPEETPTRVIELLTDCLEKDSAERLRDIGHVRIQMKKALRKPVGTSATEVTTTAQPGQQRWALGVALVLGAVVAGLAVWILIQPSSPEQSLNRFVIRPSPPVVLAAITSNEVAISPDGRQLVYMGIGEGGRQLYLRSLDDFVDRPIPGTANPGGMVFFSPDSKFIGFFAGGQLQKTSLAGGSPITLCDAGSGNRSGDWFEDTIVFTATLTSGQGLYRVSANGGEPEMLATVNLDAGESGYLHPEFLPDGKDLLFTIRSGVEEQTSWLSLETGERKVVLENARQARYLSTGHLVYEQRGTGNLMVVPFDLAALKVTGDSVSVVQGVRETAGSVDYAISRNGTLVYVPAGVEAERSLFWVDREGHEEPLAAEAGPYVRPRLSPDGLRVAITVGDGANQDQDVWIYELAGDTLTRLTFDPANDFQSLWTPDGQRVVFTSTRDGEQPNLFWKAADGTGQVERLTTSPNRQVPQSWSPDGKSLVFLEVPIGTTDLYVLSVEGERTTEPLLQTQANVSRPAISPDGRWMAYRSEETGRFEVYVGPFPNVEDGKWQISRDGGESPVWGPNGRELFYRSLNGQSMMAVRVETEPTFAAGSPEVLFTGSYYFGAGRNYDLSPDGQRFLMIKEEEVGGAQINVVLNWFEELKRLVPTN